MPEARLWPNERLRSYQFRFLSAMRAGCTRAMLCWARQTGKTSTCVVMTVERAALKPGLYLHIFPQLNQGRRVLWDKNEYGTPLVDLLFPAPIVVSKNETEMQITFRVGGGKTAIWQVLGVEDEKRIDALRGMSPYGVVVDEFAQMNPRVLAVLEPVMAQNRGWIVFPFTPRGENHAFDLWQRAQATPSWYADKQTSRTARRDAPVSAPPPAPAEDGSEVVSQEQIDRIVASGTMTREEAEQEFDCSFVAANVGAYYAAALRTAREDGRITTVPYIPGLPVKVAWDLGLGRNTFAWLYQTPRFGMVNVFDCYEGGDGDALPQHIHALKEMRPYTYGRHTVPHDAAVADHRTGQTAIEIMHKAGFRTHLAPRLFARNGKGEVRQGIDNVLANFHRLAFDAVRCHVGLVHLGGYVRREIGLGRFDDEPDPSCKEHSHAADALRYLVVDLDESNEQHAPLNVRSQFDVYDHERELAGRRVRSDFSPLGDG